MYKLICLILFLAIAAAGANRVNINEPVDSLIERLNDNLRQMGTTSVPFPKVPLGALAKYSDATILGVDSLKRTADCWEEVRGNDYLFDIRYGFGLMTIVLPHLQIAGQNMSAYARVRDNSVRLSFTLHLNDENCHVKLNDIRLEKMGNVQFGASRPEFDGSSLDGFFKYKLIPKLNDIVKSNFEKIETSLQAICYLKDFPTTDEVHELVKWLL